MAAKKALRITRFFRKSIKATYFKPVSALIIFSKDHFGKKKSVLAQLELELYVFCWFFVHHFLSVIVRPVWDANDFWTYRDIFQINMHLMYVSHKLWDLLRKCNYGIFVVIYLTSSFKVILCGPYGPQNIFGQIEIFFW